MTDKIKELLAVLDIPEEEQIEKLAYYIQPKPWKHISSGSFTPSSCDSEYCQKCRKPLRTWQDDESECSIPPRILSSLADLAFCLRDEVDFNLYLEALQLVYESWQKRGTKDEREENKLITFTCWLAVYITATDRIIAALIAKE